MESEKKENVNETENMEKELDSISDEELDKVAGGVGKCIGAEARRGNNCIGRDPANPVESVREMTIWEKMFLKE